MTPDVKDIRKRLMNYLNPETAAIAGLGYDVTALEQVAIGALPLAADRWRALALHMDFAAYPA